MSALQRRLYWTPAVGVLLKQDRGGDILGGYLNERNTMWTIGQKKIQSRLMLGSANYPRLEDLTGAITASGTNIVTVSLRRTRLEKKEQSAFLKEIEKTGVHFLPNTSGCFSLEEIITVSEMAREIFETDWVKLEAIGDDYTLFPDPVLLVQAAEELNRRGFTVFPYTSPDLVVCKKLVEAGCDILMPLAAPIGSGQGPIYVQDLERLRQRFPDQTLIVDAGIGRPSHAAQVMELGYDGVLLNTAVAEAVNPPVMAGAFAKAIEAGREAYKAGMIAAQTDAKASSPLIDRPFWHQDREQEEKSHAA